MCALSDDGWAIGLPILQPHFVEASLQRLEPRGDLEVTLRLRDREQTGRSCGSQDPVAQVRGVAALEDAHQLELNRREQVVEQVEEPPS